MAGVNKALQDFCGMPLLMHVIERMQPQCSRLLLSVEAPDTQWQTFGLAQVADPGLGSNGPLGGLLACMEAMQGDADWLLLAPCDAPFLPPDLGARLLEAANERDAVGAVVSWQGELQPTFSLWHLGLLPQVRVASAEQGMRGLKEFLQTCDPAVVEWPEQQPPPFFNINTRDGLAAAEAYCRAPASLA
jgi:molybdopterin-guanine dinucleotide biosynthesis protein A